MISRGHSRARAGRRLFSRSAKAVALATALAATLIVFSACASAPKAAVPDGEALLSGGSRVDHGDIPLLTLRGGPYARGYQYGSLLKSEIAEIMSEVLKLKEVAYVLYGRNFLTDWVLSWKLGEIEGHLGAEYLGELKGLAAGSGQSEANLLFMQGVHELSSGCSTAVAIKGGDLIHARNLDYPFLFLGRHPVIIRVEPEGGVGHWLFSFAGYLGCLTGVNDEGIFANVNAVTVLKHEKAKGPIAGFALRELLGKAHNLSEARSAVSAFESSVGWVVTVSSLKEADAFSMDLSGDARVFNEAEERGYLAVANRFLSEPMRKLSSIEVSGDAGNIHREESLAARLSAMGDSEGTGGDAGGGLTSGANGGVADAGNGARGGGAGGTANAIATLADASFGYARELYGAEDLVVNRDGTVFSVVYGAEPDRAIFSYSPGYAPFAAFHSLDLKTGEIADWREADPRYAEALERATEKEALFFPLVMRNTESLLAFLAAHPEPSLSQVSSLVKYLEDRGERALLEPLDRATAALFAQHPGLGRAALLRGKYLECAKRGAEAESAYRAVELSDFRGPEDEFYAYAALARLLKKKASGAPSAPASAPAAAQASAQAAAEAASYARRALALGDSFTLRDKDKAGLPAIAKTR